MEYINEWSQESTNEAQNDNGLKEAQESVERVCCHSKHTSSTRPFHNVFHHSHILQQVCCVFVSGIFRKLSYQNPTICYKPVWTYVVDVFGLPFIVFVDANELDWQKKQIQ